MELTNTIAHLDKNAPLMINKKVRSQRRRPGLQPDVKKCEHCCLLSSTDPEGNVNPMFRAAGGL